MGTHSVKWGVLWCVDCADNPVELTSSWATLGEKEGDSQGLVFFCASMSFRLRISEWQHRKKWSQTTLYFLTLERTIKHMRK